MNLTDPMQRKNFALWMAPVLVVIATFFISLRWLSRLDDALVLAVSAVVAIAVMGWSLIVSIRFDRGLDEVERASSQFAWRWGATAGAICTVLLLMLPPFQSFVVDLAKGVVALRGGSEELMERKALILAFTIGFGTLQLLQVAGTMVAAVWWWARKQ